MIRKSRIAVALGAFALFALAGCAALTQAVDAVAPPSPAAQASIANIVAAGENLYTATDKALKGAVASHTISVDQAQALGATDNKVYAALVPLRKGVQNGQDVTALYNAFTAVSTQFYGDVRAAGVSVAVPPPAAGSAVSS